MSRGRPQDERAPRPLPDDLQFRSAAAPGIDEDELLRARLGDGGLGGLWGEGVPSPPTAPPHERWSEEGERRRRHAWLLERWSVSPPG